MKVILWDWNGTLINDVHITVGAFNAVAEEYGYSPVSLERYREIYRHPIRELYQDAGFDLAAHPFEGIARRWSEIFRAFPRTADLHEDARPVLEALKGHGSRQSILSALPQPLLEDAVGSRDIRHLFESIHGATDDLGHGKVDAGLAVARSLGVVGPDITVIGDSSHDAEVAQELGASCALVSHGAESEARLQATGFEVFGSLSDVYAHLSGVPLPERLASAARERRVAAKK
jgi:phosphoglycolate phosphatase